jgi:hypothetical protein
MNAMPRHNVFTEIDARSYAAIVKNGWLSEVILALLVDPLEAEDVADSIRGRSETAIKLEVNGRIFVAPITLKEFQNLPSRYAFEKLKITLSQWVMTTKRADIAVKTLTIWDRRFGVWCVCAIVREALRFVPEGELRPLRAIETAEAWVRGMATAAQVSAAYADAAAYAAAADAATSAAAAARAAAAAAAAAADAATSAAAAARAAAASAAASYADAAYADAAAYASESAATSAAAAARAAAASAAASYADAAYAATAAYAAAYVAIVESTAYFAASAAVNVAEARAASAALAARAAAYSEKYRAIRDAELILLREVVANACLTFPG